MKEIIKLLNNGFESSITNTTEFKSFRKKFRYAFIKELMGYYNVKEIEFNYGHLYISGFFSLDNGKIFYFSISDVRWNDPMKNKLLIRTAKSFKDFRGGCNNYVDIKEDMFNNYQLPK